MEKGAGRAVKADLSVTLQDISISSVLSVGDCCASDPANSEAAILRRRFEDVNGLGKFLFPGVLDPA